MQKLVGDRPKAVHSALRNTLFPFFDAEHCYVLGVIAVASIMFGVAMQDWIAFVFLLSFGYILYAGLMSNFVPYELLTDASFADRIEAELDRVGFLRRQPDRLVWKRKGFLATKNDAIRLEASDCQVRLKGRRIDILPISKVIAKWN